MKLLFSSPDLEEVGYHVKRLVWARIPCAVNQDPATSYLSVWIQQDSDYVGAVGLFTRRPAPRPVAHWASALDPSPSPAWTSASVAITATNTESSRARASESVTCLDPVETPSPFSSQLSYFRL